MVHDSDSSGSAPLGSASTHQDTESGLKASSRDTQAPPTLWVLFAIFLKLGSVAFGGYLAMIAMIERELAERRKLLKNEDILDGLALATTLPGPVAVNVVSYVGFRLRGLPGALVSMLGVIIPSFILLVVLAEVYSRFGEIKEVTNVFKGFLPAVVAIIVAVGWKMGKQAITRPIHWAILLVVVTVFLSVGGFGTAIAMIAASAIIGILYFKGSVGPAKDTSTAPTEYRSVHGVIAILSLFAVSTLLWSALGRDGDIRDLWVSFSSMSVLMFGGGYVFIPMIKEVVVQQHQWLSSQEFADAIALGQVTPGPIMISATFIGYRVAGMLGAVVATVSIFLPSALLMMLFAGLHQRVSHSSIVRAAYQGIRPCIVGLIVSAAVTLARSTDPSFVTVVIFLLSLVATIRFKLDTVYVVPSAGLLGFIGYGYLV
jgi:chromate transporter